MDETKQIGGIKRVALTNNAHMGMNTELYERIMEASPAALKLEALAPLYREALDMEQRCVNRVTKSATTRSMVEKDDQRDKLYSFLRSLVKSFMSYPGAEPQRAAAELDTLFRVHPKVTEKSYVEETAIIDALLRGMENERMKAAAETLNITSYFEKLKELNDEYKALSEERTSEYAARVKVSTESARKVVDGLWARIARRVNAVAELEPSDTVDNFITTVNQIFHEYKILIAAKSKAPKARKDS